MASWGWFILVIIILVPVAYVGYIFYRRKVALKSGLPPPSFNPFASSDHGGSQIYPAPAGAIGWVKNKIAGLRNSRTKGGAYEQTSSSHRGGRGGLDPDEAWDSRVGAEADAYGTGGYYEEQELGLRPPPAGNGRTDFSGGGYGEDGSLPAYGHQDMQRGRSLSRGEDTAYVGGGKRGLDRRYDEEMHGGSKTRDPFGDAAEESSMRAVSPRPDGGPKKGRSEGGGLKTDDDPIERRSMFREAM